VQAQESRLDISTTTMVSSLAKGDEFCKVKFS
jgi:hypothetical protein